MTNTNAPASDARRRARRSAEGRSARWTPSAEAAEREIRRTRKQRYRRHRRRVFAFILALAVAIGAAAAAWGLEIVTVRGAGMSPTVESGSVVVCVRQSALDMLVGIVPESARRVGRGDPVLIRYRRESDGEAAEDAETALVIKRVIGLGGDAIGLSGGALTVNGEAVPGAAGASDRVYPVTVPGGRMFVAGDYREVSVDSRSRAFGMVPEADVVGRPVAVIWPAFAAGLVN